jgi:hypothetical protein
LKKKSKALSILNKDISQVQNQETQKSILKKKDATFFNFKEKEVNLIKSTDHLNELVNNGKTIVIYSAKW